MVRAPGQLRAFCVRSKCGEAVRVFGSWCGVSEAFRIMARAIGRPRGPGDSRSVARARFRWRAPEAAKAAARRDARALGGLRSSEYIEPRGSGAATSAPQGGPPSRDANLDGSCGRPIARTMIRRATVAPHRDSKTRTASPDADPTHDARSWPGTRTKPSTNRRLTRSETFNQIVLEIFIKYARGARPRSSAGIFGAFVAGSAGGCRVFVRRG